MVKISVAVVLKAVIFNFFVIMVVEMVIEETFAVVLISVKFKKYTHESKV